MKARQINLYHVQEQRVNHMILNEDWQYKVIAQVLGLSIQEDKNGNITFSHFPKDFVMKRVEKMGILIPVDGERKQK